MKKGILGIFSFLTLGIAIACGGQANQPKMNGKLKVANLDTTDICYTGKPFSNSLGAYIFSNRNYNPSTSRWTTPDPSGFPDGTNNQAYLAAPTSRMDPLGLWELSQSYAYPMQKTLTGGTQTVTAYSLQAILPTQQTVTDLNQLTGEMHNITGSWNYIVGNGGYGISYATVNVSSYSAMENNYLNNSPNSLGVELNITYIDGLYPVADGFTYNWIQIVKSNVNVKNGTVTVGPMVSIIDSAGTTPYYNSTYTAGGTPTPWFFDWPSRDVGFIEGIPAYAGGAGTHAPITWSADLYLVMSSGSDVYLMDGITYGFTIE